MQKLYINIDATDDRVAGVLADIVNNDDAFASLDLKGLRQMVQEYHLT